MKSIHRIILLFLSLSFFNLGFSFGAEIEKDTREAFERRILEDRTSNKLKYSFFAHKPFYILPYSYSFNPTRKATGTIDEVD